MSDTANSAPFDLREFSRQNLARCEAPNGFNHSLHSWSLSEWLVAVTGELGEAAGAVKEGLRNRENVQGKGWSADEIKQRLADELADVFIYLDLTAQAAGIDLGTAVRAKFDRTSEKIGYRAPDSATYTAMAGAPEFYLGDRVRKRLGSSWQGRVVGTYSTKLTARGYCVESEREPGSVQIYPGAVLERVP